MTSASRSLVVLAAGLSTPSSTRMLADQLTAAVRAQLTADGAPLEVHVHELRDHATDITNALVTRFPSASLQEVIGQVRAADAVIAVTPIFNMGASGLFKTFLDAVEREVWRGKPVLLGATAGTARHTLALDLAVRPSFEYLKARVVPTTVFAAAGDFGAADATEADEAPLADRAARAARELAVMLAADGAASGAAVRPARSAEQATGDDEQAAGDAAQAAGESVARGLDPEFADFTPMGKLLGGRG